MHQRLEDILEQHIALQLQLTGDFDNRLFRIEHIVVASDMPAVAWLVERNNKAVVERIGLDIDTAVVAVAVIELVDTHKDSFPVVLRAKNLLFLQLTHSPPRWLPCGRL